MYSVQCFHDKTKSFLLALFLIDFERQFVRMIIICFLSNNRSTIKVRIFCVIMWKVVGFCRAVCLAVCPAAMTDATATTTNVVRLQVYQF